MAKSPTNGERLVSLETKLDLLIKHFENHLHLHQKIILLSLGVGLTALVGGVGWVVTSLIGLLTK